MASSAAPLSSSAMCKLPKADRQAVRQRYEARGQFFCVEAAPDGGRAAACRGCSKAVAKGTLRARHVVCGTRCFKQKASGVPDSCGCWHLACLVDTQASEPARFTYTNAGFVHVTSTDQLAGFDALSDEQQRGVVGAIVRRGGTRNSSGVSSTSSSASSTSSSTSSSDSRGGRSAKCAAKHKPTATAVAPPPPPKKRRKAAPVERSRTDSVTAAT
jgi:hypothetical protein